MAANLFLLPFRPALDANAIVVPGAKLYFYATGTTTPQAVYADEALTTPLSNPVEADAAGAWPAIYLDATKVYRCILKDALGNTLPNGDTDPYVPGVVDALAPDIAENAALSEAYATAIALLSVGLIFDTTADGVDPVTGVASGETFLTWTDSRLRLYLNNAGTAVLKAELATAASTLTIVREKLTSSRTYYVRTNGSDSNDGLTNTAGGAFLTLQKAINAAYALDCNGYNVTIQVANGTYTGGMLIFGKLAGAFDNGDQPLRIIGNEGSPGSVIVNPTSADALRIGDKATLLIAGMTLRTTTSGNGITASNGAYVEHRNMVFGACASETIATSGFANVRAIGPTTVTGGSAGFVHATKRSLVSFSDTTLTFSGTPAFTTYLWGINDASVHLDSATIVGTATGGITVHINGVLQVSSSTGKWTGGVEPFVATGGRIIAEDKMQLRTFYVRTDGNDTNSGFNNTAAEAFLTIQGAINRLAKFPYDEAGYVASSDPDAGWKINVAAGTSAEDVVLRECRFFGITIEGAGVGLTSVSSFASKALNTVWNLRKMSVGGAGKTAITALRGSEVGFEDIRFVASTAHVIADSGGRVVATGNYEIAGAATWHVWSRMNSEIDFKDRTITINGTPALTTFALSEQSSILRLQGCTFTGTATGKRYDARSCGVIETNGGSSTFLPGDTAGTTASGGQYV